MVNNKIYYGVWIPGQGWLSVNGEAMAWEDKAVAASIAGRVGNNSRVEYLDDALRDLQPYLLSVEKQKKEAYWWNRVKKLIPRRTK